MMTNNMQVAVAFGDFDGDDDSRQKVERSRSKLSSKKKKSSKRSRKSKKSKQYLEDFHDEDDNGGDELSKLSNPQSASYTATPSPKEKKKRIKKEKKTKKERSRKSEALFDIQSNDASLEDLNNASMEDLIIYSDDETGMSPSLSASRKSYASSPGGTASVADQEPLSSPQGEDEEEEDDGLGDMRQLMLQYLLGRGLNQAQAERLADEFVRDQEGQSLQMLVANAASSTTSGGNVGRPKPPPPIPLSSSGRKAQEAAAGGNSQATGMSSGRPSLANPQANSERVVPEQVASDDATAASHTSVNRSVTGSTLWPRAQTPGAVEMDGRAFGAPARPEPETQQSGSTNGTIWEENDEYNEDNNGGDKEEWDDEEQQNRVFSVEARAVMTEKDLPTVYADVSPIGLKDLFRNVHPLRRLFVLMLVLMIVGIIFSLIFTIGVKDGSAPDIIYTQAPTMTPSAMPSLIATAVLEAAETISGEVEPGTPQFEAVGWISTYDQVVSGSLFDRDIFRQRYVMVVLYIATNGTDWAENEGWLDPTAHECDWSSDITCFTDPTGQRSIKGLNFVNNKLRGPIPKEIGQLSELDSMDLSQNGLTGSIPSDMFDLRNLLRCDVANNALSGSLPPNVGGMESVVDMKLSFNKLEGTIPATMFDLKRMTSLDISNNQFTGIVTDDLQKLQSLERLDCRKNQFTGTIPAFGGNLLAGNFDWNQFTGSIPAATLGNQRVFTASHNKMKGNFPGTEALGNDFDPSSPNIFDQLLLVVNRSKIERLDLSNNELSGVFPWVGLLPQLEYLDVSGNNFYGTFPAGGELGEHMWRSTTHLAIADNLMSGTLPTEFTDKLKFLDLSNNKLTGTIPGELVFLDGMDFLRISHNPLEGTLPASDASKVGPNKSIRIRSLEARGCNLSSSTLPTELNLLSKLEIVDMGENNFIGPMSLTNLVSLKRIKLDGNQLTSTIPPELGVLSRLVEVDFANNLLEGTVPSELAQLKRLRTLSLGGNDLLGGSLPGSICTIAPNEMNIDIPCTVECGCCSVNRTCVS